MWNVCNYISLFTSNKLCLFYIWIEVKLVLAHMKRITIVSTRWMKQDELIFKWISVLVYKFYILATLCFECWHHLVPTSVDFLCVQRAAGRLPHRDLQETWRRNCCFSTSRLSSSLKHCFSSQVSVAMEEEICRLHVIVDEFHTDFHPSPHVLKIYKSVSPATAFDTSRLQRLLISVSVKSVVLDLWPLTSRQELLAHVEEGMGKNLAYRCSDAVHASVHSSQSYMIGKDAVVTAIHFFNRPRNKMGEWN